MPNDTDKTGEKLLNTLIGEQLSSVEFVQDYVQLRFDGPCLTALTWPTVHLEEARYKWGMPSYRDMLCERISKIVRVVFVVEGQEIRIEFDDGAKFSISLRPEDYRTAEAAIFYGKSEQWAAW